MILVIIIILLTVVTIFGFLYVPQKPKATALNPHITPLNPICSNTPVECTTDSDCTKCLDSFKVRCTTLRRNPEQSTKYGAQKSYCLPVKPQRPCNEKLGGIWTWTGWSDENVKEWDCLCTYPEIAGGNGCQRLNGNVCKGGTYNYDARNATQGPKPSNCKCGENDQLIVTESGVPLCVPKGPGYCSDESTCKRFYAQ